MITNLLATVVTTIVTNSVETLPMHSEPIACPEGRIACLGYHAQLVPDTNPKEKWITTNVVEVTTFQFKFADHPVATKIERAITNWTTHFVLAAPEPVKWLAGTNAAVPAMWPPGLWKP